MKTIKRDLLVNNATINFFETKQDIVNEIYDQWHALEINISRLIDDSKDLKSKITILAPPIKFNDLRDDVAQTDELLSFEEIKENAYQSEGNYLTLPTKGNGDV